MELNFLDSADAVNKLETLTTAIERWRELQTRLDRSFWSTVGINPDDEADLLMHMEHEAQLLKIRFELLQNLQTVGLPSDLDFSSLLARVQRLQTDIDEMIVAAAEYMQTLGTAGRA